MSRNVTAATQVLISISLLRRLIQVAGGKTSTQHRYPWSTKTTGQAIRGGLLGREFGGCTHLDESGSWVGTILVTQPKKSGDPQNKSWPLGNYAKRQLSLKPRKNFIFGGIDQKFYGVYILPLSSPEPMDLVGAR